MLSSQNVYYQGNNSFLRINPGTYFPVLFLSDLSVDLVKHHFLPIILVLLASMTWTFPISSSTSLTTLSLWHLFFCPFLNGDVPMVPSLTFLSLYSIYSLSIFIHPWLNHYLYTNISQIVCPTHTYLLSSRPIATTKHSVAHVWNWALF